MKKIALAIISASLVMTCDASPCGFYLYGGGGVSSAFNIQDSNSIVIDGVLTNFDTHLIASNITGGANGGLGYNFWPYLGIQGNVIYWGHQDFGVASQFPGGVNVNLSAHTKTWSYGIEAIGHLPIVCDNINPFIKIGYARFQSDWLFRSNTGISLEESNSDFTHRGNGLIFGAGIDFAIDRCWDLGFLVQALYTDRHKIVDFHTTLYQFSINLIYHFGNGF